MVQISLYAVKVAQRAEGYKGLSSGFTAL